MCTLHVCECVHVCVRVNVCVSVNVSVYMWASVCVECVCGTKCSVTPITLLLGWSFRLVGLFSSHRG